MSDATEAQVKCRECGERSCLCLLVPEDKLHLESPSWEEVVLSVSPTVSQGALQTQEGYLLSAVSDVIARYFSTGDVSELVELLRKRRECVVGFRAPLPVRRVIVFANAREALRHATTLATGVWCVALPLCVPPNQEEGTFRCVISNQGVSAVSPEAPYHVVSHNWPRTAGSLSSHASVLGIWWEIRNTALRQAESVLALADLCRRPIWVDFLCIDQDNVGEKQELLPQMGRIYSNSRCGFVDCTRTPDLFTIDPRDIAALTAIGEAEHLYGDEERRRRFRIVVQAPWFSRCWTFQEALLTPELQFYDPSQDKAICDFKTLREQCEREYHHLHETMGYLIAKSEDWFGQAASLMNHIELTKGNMTWNLGNILAVRGKRNTTEECDHINSLLGILDIKCGYRGISTAPALDDQSFRRFLRECSENGDTSWVTGEDPTKQTTHLSWAPASPYAEFSTQAESASFKWMAFDEEGPRILFHRACPVLEVIAVPQKADPHSVYSQLQACQVDGEWLLEYCGVAFGEKMKDPLPVSSSVAEAIFREHRDSLDSFEKHLWACLPESAGWRVTELRNYLEGFAGRFNAWIICKTPVRRIAVMAKILTSLQPKEALLGFPSPSKHRATHSFFPLMIVDDSRIRNRVGWAWPCAHVTLKEEEARSEHCIRHISN